MNICSNHHGKVAYDGRDCPCCEVLAEKDEEIMKLKCKVSELQTDIKSFQAEMLSLQNELDEVNK